MAELDKKDRIIIYELDRNARQPFSHISKKAGLSRESVLYRVKGYLNSGTIRNFLAVIDMSKFGFSHHKVFVRLHNISRKQEAELIVSLCSNPHISWVASCDGKYTLVFGVKARNLQDLQGIMKEINGSYWHFFLSQDVASIVEARHFYRDYLVGRHGTTKREIRWSSGEFASNVDMKNIEILEKLSENPRATSVSIAKAVGLSPDAVLKKIRRLEKDGVIDHYTIWPNANMLAGEYYKVLITLQNFDSKNEVMLHAFCKEHPNIVYIVNTVGPWQFEIDIEVENAAEFREIIRSFLERFSGIVSDYSALNIYQEHKFRFFEKAALRLNE